MFLYLQNVFSSVAMDSEALGKAEWKGEKVNSGRYDRQKLFERFIVFLELMLAKTGTCAAKVLCDLRCRESSFLQEIQLDNCVHKLRIIALEIETKKDYWK